MRFRAMSLCHRWAPTVAHALVRKLATLPPAAPGSWQVSSHGRVSNLRGTISFGSAHPSGYLRAKVRGEDLYVHRIVALAFLGPPPSEDAWQVHHKDGNPGNNHILNLEYVTQSQNQRHSHASGARRSSGPAQSQPVMYRALGSKEWTRCPSVTLAALELGASRSAVSSACRQKRPLKGNEVCYLVLREPQLKGEVWKPMLCPVSGNVVPRRMVSSLGR